MANKVEIANECRRDVSGVLATGNILSKDQRSTILAAVDRLVALLEVAVRETGDLRDVRDDVARLSSKLDNMAGLPAVAVSSGSSRHRSGGKGAVGKPSVVQSARAAPLVRPVEASSGLRPEDVPPSSSMRSDGDGDGPWL